MTCDPDNRYVVPIAITLLAVSIPFGIFPWAFLSLVGLAAIQAGLYGFQPAGYGTLGRLRLTGRCAHILGMITIAIGVLWEIALIWFLIFGFSPL